MTDKKVPVRLALLPLLSIIGAGAGIYLTRTYYSLRLGTAGFQSLCNINETLNCDAVTSSKYAELFSGLPLSSFVAGWFVAILLLSLMARVSDWRREVVVTGLLMTGFASLYSVALLIVMFGVLGKICLFCLLIDGVNFALFGIFFSLLGGSYFTGVRWSKLQSHAAVIAGTVFVVVVLLRPSEENTRRDPTTAEVNYTINQILERSPVAITTPESASVLGNPNAPITIHEFSDFQCPFCKRGAVMMNQLLARYEGKIRVIFMPFPLDTSCNRLVTHAMHPVACELARAAFCADREGKFRTVYEKFFEDQEELKAGSAKKISNALGVNEATFAACLDSEAAKKMVSLSIEEGIKFKVGSTPTFFINGKMVDVALPIEAWDTLIAKLLQ